MIESRAFRITYGIIILSSFIFGSLSYFRIAYQFYVWELFIDIKVIVLLGILFFLYKKNKIDFSLSWALLTNWSWKRNLLFFIFPLCVYAISISIGVLSKQTHLAKLDNASTLILATIFDIPAIFVFSFSSILVEEFFFRGIIFSSIQSYQSKIVSFSVTNILWAIYCIPEVLGVEEVDALKFFTILFFFLSVGILCSVLADKYRSLWFGYSLRVGLITLTPITISSLLAESDSFFITDSMLFVAEGVVVSSILFIGSFVLFRKIKSTVNPIQEIFEK